MPGTREPAPAGARRRRRGEGIGHGDVDAIAATRASGIRSAASREYIADGGLERARRRRNAPQRRLEEEIRGQHEGAVFVPSTDDVVERIGGLAGAWEIANLSNTGSEDAVCLRGQRATTPASRGLRARPTASCPLVMESSVQSSLTSSMAEVGVVRKSSPRPTETW
ncbi:hypothetical protein A7982_13657 [Minicystis rosea]|nr:hypothetical protein A7982_13657 [Minicystis rosea]